MMDIDAGTIYTLADGLIRCMDRLDMDYPGALDTLRDHAEYEAHLERNRRLGVAMGSVSDALQRVG